MGKNNILLLCFALCGIFLFAANLPTTTPVVLELPQDWPEPLYDFEKNPLTQEGISLGRKLFYDPIFSKDSSTSCSSCHLSFTAFTHVDHALSHGIADSIGNRNSMALMNLAWSKHFMWDGAVNHLDMQALAPINDPKEMGETTSDVIGKLQSSEIYPELFEAAFSDSIITGEHFLKALAQFQLTFISANSKYDKVMRKENGIEFNEQESKGYELFKNNCASCHTEPLFTTGEFANNGLPVDTILNDVGRMAISLNTDDSLKFKIPSLRNIEFSRPYMHDGRFKKLRQVVEHYSNGIVQSSTLASELESGIELGANEKVDLIAFLLTLSDREFVMNSDLSYPLK